jgi:hypothetical protein
MNHPPMSGGVDIRLLLPSFAESSGEIQHTAHGVVVALKRPDAHFHARALRGLCTDPSQLQAVLPGTGVPVTNQVAVQYPCVLQRPLWPIAWLRLPLCYDVVSFACGK